MGVADAQGLPLAIHAAAATPHEIALVPPTLAARFVAAAPHRRIGDKAYDSDLLDQQLAARGVALIAPHKRHRRAVPTQDGRALRRYKRRWKIERLWAWLQSFRRILTRFDSYVENFLGFVHLGCLSILLRRYL
jgi:transposase